jgi:hypothetical protein
MFRRPETGGTFTIVTHREEATVPAEDELLPIQLQGKVVTP